METLKRASPIGTGHTPLNLALRLGLRKHAPSAQERGPIHVGAGLDWLLVNLKVD
jgi:hypothetical protein